MPRKEFKPPSASDRPVASRDRDAERGEGRRAPAARKRGRPRNEENDSEDDYSDTEAAPRSRGSGQSKREYSDEEELTLDSPPEDLYDSRAQKPAKKAKRKYQISEERRQQRAELARKNMAKMQESRKANAERRKLLKKAQQLKKQKEEEELLQWLANHEGGSSVPASKPARISPARDNGRIQSQQAGEKAAKEDARGGKQSVSAEHEEEPAAKPVSRGKSNGDEQVARAEPRGEVQPAARAAPVQAAERQQPRHEQQQQPRQQQRQERPRETEQQQRGSPVRFGQRPTQQPRGYGNTQANMAQLFSRFYS